ncbi:MAG: hypothetical protein VB088_09540 [Sphaerochaeta sp.]|jgi:hypothetical protein|uniref:hypothetical protein n=1 Tax=unclassified Sphaerochaeta TaxID=2637943 RepID=UPI000A9BD39E|nr:hypothetical protein [Sphaerochaeta sp. UBA5856]MCK9601574.1 hypothetical protein [Sphaerochaeta sp.]MEA4865624.1 hypothetical protein [Sphaerochaeta sp.]
MTFCRHRDAGILLGYPSLLIRFVLDNPEEQHVDELAPWSFWGSESGASSTTKEALSAISVEIVDVVTGIDGSQSSNS